MRELRGIYDLQDGSTRDIATELELKLMYGEQARSTFF